MTHHRVGQCGATTLLVVTVLVTLAAVSAAMGVRSLWLERLGSDNRAQALQARMAAESALARAAAALQKAAQQDDLASFWQHARAADCPASHPAPGWECRRLDWPAHQGVDLGSEVAEGWFLQALALRHLTRSPHVVEVIASARQGPVLAQVGQSLYQPALAPLPPDRPPDGPTDWSPEWPAQPTSPRPATGGATSANSGCMLPAWRQALGPQTEAALRQLSDSQARAGLDDGSNPARTVYWVDSPQPWTLSLGQPGRPVLLVFSRQACAGVCPRLTASAHVHGTVVFDAGCAPAALPRGAAGQIDGQVSGQVLGPPVGRTDPAGDASLPATSAASAASATSAASDAPAGAIGSSGKGRITPTPYARDALALRWPQGMDATQVQWVAGSWSLQAAP